MKILQKIILFLLLAFIWISCRPSAESYLEQAAEALKKENSKKAFRLFQEAYEASLSDDLFPLGRDARFSLSVISANQNKILLGKYDAKERESVIFLYAFNGEEQGSHTIKGAVEELAISPNGNYQGALLRFGEKCVWQIFQHLDLVQSFRSECGGKIAISNDGVIWNKQDKFLVRAKLPNLNFTKISEKFPDPPLPGFPAYAYYDWVQDKLFMNFGYAGLYKFYVVTKNEFHLTKELAGAVASPYFYRAKDASIFGLILGGAGDHKVRYFNQDLSVVASLPVKQWRDVFYVDENLYYYIEGSVISSVRKGQDNVEPFWTKQIVGYAHNKLWILSGLGTLMIADSKKVLKDSLSIFDKGREIDPQD
ncbi:MAG: hypothetical protein D6767_09050 [Candidatus Hydrogenedentota bacterium]|nr:MAG: hypothetical protein D6767_09050 [Candidatus Hydrogenedentota bacterium]